MAKKHRIEELQDLIDSTRAEIKRLQGEHDFLWQESQRFYAMKLAEMNKRVAEDPQFAKILGSSLGEKFVEETIQGSRETLDGVPIDKEQLKTSYSWIIDILVDLHQKQVNSYSELLVAVDGVQYGEYLDDSFEKDLLKESINKSVTCQRSIINYYSDSKKAFFKCLE